MKTDITIVEKEVLNPIWRSNSIWRSDSIWRSNSIWRSKSTYFTYTMHIDAGGIRPFPHSVSENV